MTQFIEFVLNHWALWLAFAIIVGLLLSLELRTKIRGIPLLSAQQIVNIINHDNAIVVDIRDAKSFLHGHILGAINVAVDELKQNVSRLQVHKDKPLIVVDSNGQQAGNIVAELQKSGFTQLKILRGGMAAWQNVGFPLVKNNN